MKPHQGWGISIAVISQCAIAGQALAQLKADQTSNTQIVKDTPVRTLIQGGRRVNDNLFHSFQDFSILKSNETVQFVLPNQRPITNIFARVTGKNRSLINGTIAGDGQANLFLINPNGITFQGNSRVKIGGAFIGTTAQAIQFENGQMFSAIAPQDPQLLTVKTPVGIQFGANPGSITNQTNTLRGLNKTQLILLGGALQFAEGNIDAPESNVTLGAVGANQFIPINLSNLESPLDFQAVTQFEKISFQGGSIKTISENPSPADSIQGKIQLWGNDISFDQASRLQASVNDEIELHLTGTLTLNQRSKFLTDTRSELGSGDITIQARRVSLNDGSQINASVTGGDGAENNPFGGNITLRIQDQLEISGISPISGESSAILSDGFENGNGGVIEIDAPQIDLSRGGLIRSQAFNRGQGGQILVKTDVLRLTSGSQVSSTATRQNLNGEAGSISIDASQGVYLAGSLRLPISQTRRQTAIRAEAFGQGRAGKLEINTPVLELLDGAQVSNTTRGTAGQSLFNIRDRLLISGLSNNKSSGIFSDSFLEGQAGPIQIHAHQIELNEGGLIRSQVFNNGTGGDISIETTRLSVQQGSQISNSATRREGVGIPGELRINARDSIDISGSIVVPSTGNTRFSAIRSEAKGNSTSGDIVIATDQLTLSEGALISNTTAGNSRSSEQNGTIELTLNQLSLQGSLKGSQTHILSDTQGRSPAGTISIQAPHRNPLRLLLAEDTLISASASEQSIENSGNSGLITLGSPTAILIQGPGKIAAETSGEGNGGEIQLKSPIIQIQATEITSQSFGQSSGGNIVVEGNILVLRDRASLSTNSEQSLGGNIQLNLNRLALLLGESKITTNAASNGGSILGNPPLPDQPWLIAPPRSGVKITANSFSQQGGNIDLGPYRILGFNLGSNDSIRPQSLNQISATGSTPAQAGQIIANIVTDLLPSDLPGPPVITASTLRQQCNAATSAPNQSTFRTIGQGGLYPNPSEGESVEFWDDTRIPTYRANQPPVQFRTENERLPVPLEAQGWMLQPASGKVHLLASVLSGQDATAPSVTKPCDRLISSAP